MARPIQTGAVLLCAALGGCAAPGRALLADPTHDVEVVTIPALAPTAAWTPGAGGVIAIAAKTHGYAATRATYTNYRLHVEWRWTGKPGNGGVLLNVASGPKDGVWPVSLQVQTRHGFAGDLLPMAGAGFAEPLTSAPGAYPAIKAHLAPDSEKPAGQWNSMDVVCRDGVVEVAINGVPQNHASGVTPRAGHIGFQFEGAAYALRHLRIEPLE